jgi:hypothetical protein
MRGLCVQDRYKRKHVEASPFFARAGADLPGSRRIVDSIRGLRFGGHAAFDRHHGIQVRYAGLRGRIALRRPGHGRLISGCSVPSALSPRKTSIPPESGADDAVRQPIRRPLRQRREPDGGGGAKRSTGVTHVRRGAPNKCHGLANSTRAHQHTPGRGQRDSSTSAPSSGDGDARLTCAPARRRRINHECRPVSGRPDQPVVCDRRSRSSVRAGARRH